MHVDRLARALRPHPDVKVVVSSSWRESSPSDTVLTFLGPIAERVLGSTPGLPGALRQTEIEAWLSGHTEVESWIAIDDMPRLFRPGCPWLLVTDAPVGLDGTTWLSLDAWLREDELLPEESEVGSFCVERPLSRTRSAWIEYEIFRRSKRILIEADRLDTDLLTNFLFDGTTQLGLERVWCDDNQRSMPNYTDWHISAHILGMLLMIEATLLAKEHGGQRTLVMTPDVHTGNT